MKLVTGLLFASLAACADTEGSSSYSLTQEPGACGSLETHVFGIHHSFNGKATIHVARPGSHAIVVSAHEATAWTITADPGVTIEAIYAVGFARQTVTGPRGVPVVTESSAQGDPYQCGYQWPASTSTECNTEELINFVEKRVHSVTSFHGCEAGGGFTIGTDLAVTTSSCDGAVGQTDFVQNCDGEDSCGGPLIL